MNSGYNGAPGLGLNLKTLHPKSEMALVGLADESTSHRKT